MLPKIRTEPANLEPKRPRRPKGERTEELFREAARRVFARDGYLNAKLEDIAAEAGKSPASFYNYFESKGALLAALAEDFHEQTSRAISAGRPSDGPPEEQLRAAIAIWVHNYRDRLGVMVGVFQASMVDDVFNDMWRAIRNHGIELIARDIRHAQREGYCPGLDPRQMASALSSMLEHHCYVWLAQGGDQGMKEFDEDEAIRTLSALWFHAIYWKP